jgi:hypothetical protein
MEFQEIKLIGNLPLMTKNALAADYALQLAGEKCINLITARKSQ